MQKINVMRNIEIEKLTLNVGAGKDQVVLNKGIKLIKSELKISLLSSSSRKKTVENVYYNGKSQPSPTMYYLLFNSKKAL